MSDLAMDFYRAVKHHSSCLICGGPGVQFHHCRPVDKIAEIHKIAKHGDLTSTIDEMQKCVTLCDAHHRAVHRGVIPGWLDGHHDNGKPSTAFAAAPFMPYLVWFGRKHPHVLKRFHRDYIDRDHRALWPVFNAAGIALPKSQRLVLVGDSERRAHSGPDNTPSQAA